MIPRCREYLRTLVTGNGSEVVLPWFPEYDATTPEMRLIRRMREEPPGPAWINYPLAFIIWTTFSVYLAARVCLKDGGKVSKTYGVSRIKQFFQMVYLAWFKNLSPLNYQYCSLYKPEFRKHAEEFIPSYFLGRLTKQLNKGRPTERLDHKLRAYKTFTEAGLPTVEIVEVFHADGSREFSRTDDELSRFIGQDFFVKPVNLYMGLNSKRWMYVADTGSYTDGEKVIPASELWSTLAEEASELGQDRPDKQARLVQPLVRNHPDLAPLSKYSLNTFRINTMRFVDGRVELHDVCFKMGYGDAVDDTTSVVATIVDMETGLMGKGWNSANYPGQFLEKHPTTGAQILGTKVPCWEELKALAFRAHDAFPENPIIGWDIAVTPEGPLIIEANCNANFAVVQLKLNAPMSRSLFRDIYWSWMD